MALSRTLRSRRRSKRLPIVELRLSPDPRKSQLRVSDLLGCSNAGGGTRTPDTRIMMGDTQGPDGSEKGLSGTTRRLSSAEAGKLGVRRRDSRFAMNPGAAKTKRRDGS